MDPPKFSQELSKYFKHNNLSSFIRQLNMYGFRKVATIENSGLHLGTDDLHFYHPDFIRDKPERLEAIKRKLPQKIAESADLRNVIKSITDIEDKQKVVTSTLSEIKRENEMLWAELHDLRQKHQQQQLYISRLMKLVFEAMEQNGIKTNMLQLKRNSPLMIEGGGEDTAQVMVADDTSTRLVCPEDSDALYQQAAATSLQAQSLIEQLPDPEILMDSVTDNCTIVGDNQQIIDPGSVDSQFISTDSKPQCGTDSANIEVQMYPSTTNDPEAQMDSTNFENQNFENTDLDSFLSIFQ